MCLLLSACVAKRDAAVSTEQAVPVRQRFLLMVKFASEEDSKRVPYKFQHLRFELVSEVSLQDRIYECAIQCTEQEIDGFVLKLNDEEGIVWANRKP